MNSFNIMQDSFQNFFRINHPILQCKLTQLRDKYTERKIFSGLIEELSCFLAYEAIGNLIERRDKVTSSMNRKEKTKITRLEDMDFTVVPVLRAGLGMVKGILRMLPTATVGHIGFARDSETLKPTEYYFKIPTGSHSNQYVVCDPVLGTGNTACSVLKRLKQNGIRKIVFFSIIATPLAVNKMFQENPEVPIYAISLDRGLGVQRKVVPGVGDVGERLYDVFI